VPALAAADNRARPAKVSGVVQCSIPRC
jgi:hypothetical protein